MQFYVHKNFYETSVKCTFETKYNYQNWCIHLQFLQSTSVFSICFIIFIKQLNPIHLETHFYSYMHEIFWHFHTGNKQLHIIYYFPMNMMNIWFIHQCHLITTFLCLSCPEKGSKHNFNGNFGKMLFFYNKVKNIVWFK